MAFSLPRRKEDERSPDPRAIAEMCGVSNHFVDSLRPEPTGNESQLKRMGRDGKERPAYLGEPKIEEEEHGETEKLERRKVGPPGRRAAVPEHLPRARIWTDLRGGRKGADGGGGAKAREGMCQWNIPSGNGPCPCIQWPAIRRLPIRRRLKINLDKQNDIC